MTLHSLPNIWKCRNRVVSGIFCAFTLSLLIAAFGFTSLHAQTRAYVVNQNDNTVSVIDTSTNTVVATIPVGGNPTGVAVSPDGTRAFVSNANSNSVSVIDTSTNTVTATINNIPQPLLLSVTPDGKNLYVPASATFPGIVDVVNTATNAVSASIQVPSQPIAVAITPNGARAYCLSLTGSGPNFGAVSVIDTASNTVVAGPISVPWFALAAPSSMAITPAGNFVYVSGAGFDVVSVISTTTNTVSATVSLPSGSFPFALAITPDGSKVYVPTLGTNSVSIIDTATNTLEVASIPVGSGPAGVAITADGAFAYVTNAFDNTVSVISTASNTVVATVPVGSFPEDIAMRPVVPASGTTCNGTFNGTFKGNLTVSAGQMCTFVGGGVTGNVQQAGGNLTLIRTQVSGNLQITGASTFSVGPGTSVSGDLQVQNLPASAAQNQICGSSVHGNLVFQNSGTALLIGASSSCPGNTVGNDLTVQNNTAATSIIGNTVTGNLVDQGNTAPTQVFNNIVGNNLQCQSNTSITGGGNTAKSKQGQCTSF